MMSAGWLYIVPDSMGNTCLKYTVNVEIFCEGVIFAFFTIINLLQKFSYLEITT